MSPGIDKPIRRLGKDDIPKDHEDERRRGYSRSSVPIVHGRQNWPIELDIVHLASPSYYIRLRPRDKVNKIYLGDLESWLIVFELIESFKDFFLVFFV